MRSGRGMISISRNTISFSMFYVHIYYFVEYFCYLIFYIFRYLLFSIRITKLVHHFEFTDLSFQNQKINQVPK